MNPLDEKINQHFSGLVVRKDLVKTVKGNAIVPTYVLEYLLGQYCATSDKDSIISGIETVKEILRKHYVHRSEAGLVKSIIREQTRHRVIDKISVSLNEKADTYEAEFSNLGINKVLVDADTIKRHPKLLVSGVWCIADLEYQFSEDKRFSPWIMNSLKPIQLSHFDAEQYIQARRQFSTDEWLDLLIQSIGFNPELFGKRSKLLQLIRLIPYCERNYNLIELGPKGTGKSHIYSEFSPHGILISGGEVSVPKLFVNNSTGRIGLVGYWDAVAFDEFAGKKKRADKALVDILKNYMANKTFSRGIETLGAEASMAFVGNTQHTLPYMLKHTNLFDDLPEQYYDSAFLDRLHFYVPGWEVDIIRGEMFSDGYGFVVDYLAEILRSFRNYDFSQKYKSYFELTKDISTRDRDGIQKTFSGLMKILFPHDEATPEEVEWVFRFAIEGRKRVKDQLMRIDSTYADVNFGYTNLATGEIKQVRTLEEEQYPQHFRSTGGEEDPAIGEEPVSLPQLTPVQVSVNRPKPQPGHLTFQENQRGVTFEKLFAAHLAGATEITVTDAYIRAFFQLRNWMEFVEMLAEIKPEEDELKVHLITSQDDFYIEKQLDVFEKIQATMEPVGIHFSWEFDDKAIIHARHISTNHGWKILLDRGLDIFQPYEMNDSFALANRKQQFRSCKAFEITYLRVEDGTGDG
ncbi:MAG: TIGR02688 family protein [Anaerolineaceae bacterium]|nr:TIGR02688 family protein [Anaerolineaceae bacterium]